MASPNLKDATRASLEAMEKYGTSAPVRAGARDELARRRRLEMAALDLEAVTRRLVSTHDALRRIVDAHRAAPGMSPPELAEAIDSAAALL